VVESTAEVSQPRPAAGHWSRRRNDAACDNLSNDRIAADIR
jgi:hypothetical protein